MEIRTLLHNVHIRTGATICLCFLFISTGWLSWLYRIMYLGATSVDFFTMVIGYLMQALGIGAYVIFEHKAHGTHSRALVLASIGLFALLLAPATLSSSLATVLVSGFAANVAGGVIQGFYLSLLATRVKHGWRGTVFGAAYGASTLFGWMLGLPAAGMLTQGVPCLVSCLLMAAVAIGLILAMRQEARPSLDPSGSATSPRLEGRSLLTALALPCMAAGLVSLVKTAGFSFPATDLASGVNLELSRLFYGIGLVLAGLASDRDRRLGMLFCGVALVMPFLMLSLSGAGASATLLWALGYLLTGFYVLFRVLLTVDLASGSELCIPHLAGLGLLFGRVGDALGTQLCLMLGHKPVVLIGVTAVLFMLAIGTLLVLYHRLYAPKPSTATASPSEQELFVAFASRYDLSKRERDVLRLVLAEKSNGEIAGELFVSENTVKYHVRNLLKKTGCKRRLEMVDLYKGSGQAL